MLVAALVFGVALGANRPPVRDILIHRSFDVRRLSDVLVLLAGVALVALCAIVYILLRDVRGRTRYARKGENSPLSPRAKAIAAFLVVAFIGGCVAAILFGHSRYPADENVLPSLLPELPSGSIPGAGDSSPPVVHWWVIGIPAVVVLGVLAFVFFLQRRRRRKWRQEEGPRSDRRELRTAVEASLKDLEQTSDHRGAVIRAYATMERVLAQHGLARRQAEAPFEYLSRWTSTLQIGRSTAGALTTLYEWAKFSPHSVDETMKEQATEALAALRRELEKDPG